MLPMSDPQPSSSMPTGLADAPSATSNARTPERSAVSVTRRVVAVHRLDGRLERGESDAHARTSEGFPIYTPPDLQRARWTPVRDIKSVLFGSLEMPDLEADP